MGDHLTSIISFEVIVILNVFLYPWDISESSDDCQKSLKTPQV